jgi:hypothetical protein
MYQQLWGYKVEEKLYLGVREQKRLNTTGVRFTSQYEEGRGMFTQCVKRGYEPTVASGIVLCLLQNER